MAWNEPVVNGMPCGSGDANSCRGSPPIPDTLAASATEQRHGYRPVRAYGNGIHSAAAGDGVGHKQAKQEVRSPDQPIEGRKRYDSVDPSETE
jgi:hypothetical protein